MRVASRLAAFLAASFPATAAMAVSILLGGCSPSMRGSRADSTPTASGQAVVAFAAAQVGRRYCWGGTGPTCFDCSGLVGRAWASAGVKLPRTSSAIAGALPEVPLDELRAGDILWWPGHVGIYAGEGWMIDALDSRDGVVRRRVRDPRRAYRPGGG